MELTLVQLFGVNAFQDGQVLIINKSDLPGLTPLANNTAESLLVAIILKSLENFQGTIKDEYNNAITDEYNNVITYDNTNQFSAVDLFLWASYLESRVMLNVVICHQLIIHFYTLYDSN